MTYYIKYSEKHKCWIVVNSNNVIISYQDSYISASNYLKQLENRAK